MIDEVRHIPKIDDVCFEATIVLDNLIQAFFCFALSGISENDHKRLLEAAHSQEENFADLPMVIKRVSFVMKDIYYDMTGDTTKLADIRRKVDELGSILHIGRSYPQDALRRAKKIKSLYVEKMKGK